MFFQNITFVLDTVVRLCPDDVMIPCLSLEIVKEVVRVYGRWTSIDRTAAPSSFGVERDHGTARPLVRIRSTTSGVQSWHLWWSRFNASTLEGGRFNKNREEER